MDNLSWIERFFRVVSRAGCLTSSTFRAGEKIEEVLPGKLDYLGNAKSKPPFKNHSWNSGYKRETSKETVGNGGQNMEVLAIG